MAKKKNITISDIIIYKFYSGLGYIFKFLFALFCPKKLSSKREVSDLNVLLFSGQKGGKMLKAVLLSIYSTWEKIPHITIGTDGTPNEYFENIMKFWPFPYQVKSWKELTGFHLAKGGVNLVEYAEINLYARKIVCFLAEAESKPTLYCDTDVLWFAEPRLPARTSPDGFAFRMSGDNTHSYHPPSLRYFKRQDLLEKPALNAGVMYMSGSIYRHYPELENAMGFFKLFEDPFSEQTAFALIADRLGDSWTLDEILLSTKDIHWPLIPRYFFSGDHFARHHVATKNSWFWRDALYILLCKKPNTRRSSAVLNHV